MSTTPPSPIQHSKHLTEIAPDTFVDASGHQLTPKEVRNIVTPHDFAVSAELFGLKLAKPWRRGVAMALDALLITILAGNGSLLFVTPLFLYLIWRCHKLQTLKRRNILLAIIPFVLLFSHQQNQKTPSTPSVDVADVVQLSTAAIALSKDNCDERCADKQSNNLIATLSHDSFSDEKALQTLQDLLAQSALTAEQQQTKLDLLTQKRLELSAARTLLAQQAPAGTAATSKPALSWWQKLQQSDHSIVKWTQGILEDLGISFGWAVAYFTLFISWNNGQTPGKRLLRIRVVQLDNKPLSLWGAFGRQGGYSAGFATGLLGFAQIYWDPNRQAMQDKLADTLVLLDTHRY